MKIVLFVEGHTEKALPELLKRWLDPRLPQPIGIKIARFEGWRRRCAPRSRASARIRRP
ncbi:uncharacterized protein SOCE26_077770 [Sorangium cellulosum]|uniref:DUF4276 family protein n=1 Tax=Sorangium cellulosum TaxID=56 RepID=A0A2L0F3Y8_SORCE|nr:uncharacterized protein SOCE26_077770 [Sorangium cellulosum]